MWQPRLTGSTLLTFIEISSEVAFLPLGDGRGVGGRRLSGPWSLSPPPGGRPGGVLIEVALTLLAANSGSCWPLSGQTTRSTRP